MWWYWIVEAAWIALCDSGQWVEGDCALCPLQAGHRHVTRTTTEMLDPPPGVARFVERSPDAVVAVAVGGAHDGRVFEIGPAAVFRFMGTRTSEHEYVWTGGTDDLGRRVYVPLGSR